MREDMAGLCARIDSLQQDVSRLSRAALCTRVDELRSTAAAGSMPLAAIIAGALSALLAIGDRRALIGPYLDVMREAAGCGRSDAAAAEAFLAAVGVRLAH